MFSLKSELVEYLTEQMKVCTRSSQIIHNRVRFLLFYTRIETKIKAHCYNYSDT